MTRRLTLGVVLLAGAICGPASLAATAAAEPGTQPKTVNAARDARRAATGADFQQQGVQAGDQVPDLDVVTIDGAPTKLSKLWQERPTLLVTASLTCGAARNNHAWVTEAAKKYGDRLNVAVLYTLEAHPVDDPSPYAKYSPELENPERPGERPGGNRGEEGFARRQPTDLEGREELAREFKDLIDFAGPIVIDGMDNQAWEALGAGPNMGFLIGRDGKVIVKHGWLEDDTMERSIGEFLATQP
jgi:hypothetical protein